MACPGGLGECGVSRRYRRRGAGVGIGRVGAGRGLRPGWLAGWLAGERGWGREGEGCQTDVPLPRRRPEQPGGFRVGGRTAGAGGRRALCLTSARCRPGARCSPEGSGAVRASRHGYEGAGGAGVRGLQPPSEAGRPLHPGQGPAAGRAPGIPRLASGSGGRRRRECRGALRSLRAAGGGCGTALVRVGKGLWGRPVCRRADGAWSCS